MRKIKQYSILLGMSLWALIALLIMISEKSPESSMPFWVFAIVKLIAVISLFFNVHLWRKLENKGYMPEFLEEKEWN